MSPITRLQPETRLTGAVIHNGVVYLAGQVTEDVTLDIEGQMADILRQVDAQLAEAGTDKSRLLSVQIFLANMDDLDGMNRAWDVWLDRDNKPARATVEARLADPLWRVELTAIAAL
ncbi:Endoribonuclease L-PSP [Gluconacetobacter diazotrophicus PA1 5]|nr:RidA family protein [Gluconacetobacter diazotrophicus]ACI50515.1 Endoribonuclease L-PSP [Gluconacetobacter diazotrophicus PA1 5]TWB09347.1 enamine deaminase RidA (YjgF/YER057c/UK114 family) [Gluconacetobacter diazotrophicus]